MPETLTLSAPPAEDGPLPGAPPGEAPVPAPAPDLEALARENGSLRAALEQARAEAEAGRRRSLAARRLRDGLAARGAMPGAVELLAASVPPERLTLAADGGSDGAEALLDALEARYGFLFRPATVVAAAPADPPRAGTALSPAALRAMSEAEINRNWGEVREALRR